MFMTGLDFRIIPLQRCLSRAGSCLAAVLALALLANSPAIAAENLQSVHIAGSNTLRLFVQLAAELYMKEHNGSIVTVAGGGSSRGIKSLLDATAEIAMISSHIPEELQRRAKSEAISLKIIPICHDAVVPVVNPRNPVSGISLEQLKKIYSGRIVNWKELGGEDAAIIVTTHDGFSGTYELWKEKVLGSDAAITPQAKTLEMQPMLRAVAADKNAIGYVAWTLLDGSVKALTVDGVKLNQQNILDGSYPLSRILSLVIRENAPAATLDFVRFMLAPDKGMGLATTLRMLPVGQSNAQ